MGVVAVPAPAGGIPIARASDDGDGRDGKVLKDGVAKDAYRGGAAVWLLAGGAAPAMV